MAAYEAIKVTAASPSECLAELNASLLQREHGFDSQSPMLSGLPERGPTLVKEANDVLTRDAQQVGGLLSRQFARTTVSESPCAMNSTTRSSTRKTLSGLAMLSCRTDELALQRSASRCVRDVLEGFGRCDDLKG